MIVISYKMLFFVYHFYGFVFFFFFPPYFFLGNFSSAGAPVYLLGASYSQGGVCLCMPNGIVLGSVELILKQKMLDATD